jgi:transcriptional regulator with XRE-family HTH domain
MPSGSKELVGATRREREVRRLLAAGERDGLTLREMATRAGVATGTLAWWRSEIRRRDAERAASEELPEFVEIAATSEPELALLHFEVELRGGRRIRVPAEYGLARLVRDVEACRRHRCL